jgi:hypothetical protein
MGNFYTNYVLRGPSQQSVADELTGRRSTVTPAQNGCVVVFDAQSDEQDMKQIAELAARLSRRFSCPVLALLNHDDDVFWYQLYENGEKSDEYDSSPGYFDPSAEPSAPNGGNAQKLCSAFGATDATGVERILRQSSYDENSYTFAVQRHADLFRSLGLPEFGVGISYASLERGEYPEGLTSENLMRAA